MRARLARLRADDGFTLIELLVASAMGVVVMGAVAMLVIGAVRHQPRISKQAQNITTARWVLERMTRELRGGISVVDQSPSKVSFEGYVRRATCGGSTPISSTASPIECLITYECSTSACFRAEAPVNGAPGSSQQIFSGIDSNQVFTFAPDETEPTYVKVTLRLPNPSGPGALTVSDGASLRNATLGY